jgi:hypothetical protein
MRWLHMLAVTGLLLPDAQGGPHMAKSLLDRVAERIRELDATEEKTTWDVAFAMGDAVLEAAPIGQRGIDNGSGEILRLLAEKSDVEPERLRERRFVSSRVPNGARAPFVVWAVYRQIAHVDDERERERLFKKVATEEATQLVDGVWRPTKTKRWTVDAIMTHIYGKSANPAAGSEDLLRRAFKDAEAPTISKVLAEQPELKQQAVLRHTMEQAAPETIGEVLESPQARRNVYSGLQQHEQRASERTERWVQRDPIARRLDQHQAMLDLERWGDHVRGDIEHLRADILPRLGEIPDADPLAFGRFLADMLADLDAAIAPVRHFVETGSTDIDSFLQAVLKGSR